LWLQVSRVQFPSLTPIIFKADLQSIFNERSIGLRHRRSLAFQVLALTGVVVATGCGDDKPARDQTVFWTTLSTSLGNTCSSAKSFNLPDSSARDNIINGGGGERLEDGGDSIVECGVTEGAAAGTYNVTYRISVGEIGSYSASGIVTVTPGQAGGASKGTGTLNVDFSTTQFSLGQRGCEATVEQVGPGVIWISNLSCPELEDPSSPSISCVGTGGWIAENCSK
jgi:hypothetical protein